MKPVISARSCVAGVIGSPVSHSLSPVIHNAAFAAHGDDWVYVAFEVRPEDAGAAIDAVRVLGIAGLSVTMPHKELVIDALDHVDSQAAVVRAVNTVVRTSEGRLVGYNTDGTGCVDALTAAGADLSSVGVIGAGATARSVIAALATAGSRISVVNRSADRLAAAVEIGNSTRSGSTIAAGADSIGECTTIINTTPQGMEGVANGVAPLDVNVVSQRHTVMDAVYHPLDTELLLAARQRGARTVDGLEMLCAQAARQQELWLGRRPDVRLMREAALVELSRRQR